MAQPLRTEYIELHLEVTQHQEQSRECADGVFKFHWTTGKVKGKVKEHLTALIAVNNKQEEAMKQLVSAHKTIKTSHETLVSQFQNLAASKAALRIRLLRIREQLQGDQSGQVRTGAHSQVQ